MQECWYQYRPVPLPIIDPLGRAKALISRAPVEQAGITVQGVQQICCCTDDSEKIQSNLSLGHYD